MPPPMSNRVKQKVHWSRFSQEEINEKFVAPLLTSLASFDHDDSNDVSESTDKIMKLIVDCSLLLVTRRRHHKWAIYAKMPDDVKATRFCSKNAFDSWKGDEFSNLGVVHDNYRLKHRGYWELLCKFLTKLETDKIKRSCVAAKFRDGSLFFLSGGYHFGGLQTTFFKE